MHELGSGGAQGVRNIFVHGELFQVGWIEKRKHVKADVEGSFGIIHEVADHDIILAKSPIAGDEAENFVGEIGHGSEGFDLLIGEARRLQNRALDDLAAVADERAPGVRATFDGELHALRHRHTGDLLEQRLAAAWIRFGLGGRIGNVFVISRDSGTAQFVKNVLLVRGQRVGMLESGHQAGRRGDAVQFLHQQLALSSRKMGNERDQERTSTISVREHGVDNGRMLPKIFPGVAKQSREGSFTLQGLDEDIGRTREQRFLSAVSDHFVGIMSQDSKNFDTINGRNVSARRADGNFTFAWGAGMPQIIENFRGEDFHR